MKRVRALCQGCTACQREMLNKPFCSQGNDMRFHPLAAAGLQGTCPDEFIARSPAAGSSQKPSHLACHVALVKHIVQSSLEPFCGDWVRMG